jgi:hypothetical protein
MTPESRTTGTTGISARKRGGSSRPRERVKRCHELGWDRGIEAWSLIATLRQPNPSPSKPPGLTEL